MARARVDETPGLGIELGVREGRARGVGDALDEHVELLQHPRRPASRTAERPHRAAQLTHRDGRGEPVPDDVAHDERDRAVGELERVVPVAPDLERRRAGAVRRADRHVREGRRLPQEPELQRVRDATLTLVQPRVVERQRRDARDLAREAGRDGA